RFERIDELHLAETGRLLHRQRAAEHERSVHARAAVAVAKFGVDSDDFAARGLEVGKIRPGKLELDFRALLGLAGPDLYADFGDLLEETGPQTEPRLQLIVLISRPVAVNRADRFGRPGDISEVAAPPRVEIPLDRISLPEMIVISLVGLFL